MHIAIVMALVEVALDWTLKIAAIITLLKACKAVDKYTKKKKG